MPELSFLTETRLDPQRLDVIRTYILACSKHEPGKGRCRPDMAVVMRYDLQSGDVSEVKVLRNIKDARGMIRLPRLAGR